MIDHKQEAIDFETFRKMFNEEWYKTVDGITIDGRDALKALYARIAPLIKREFPEEEFELIIYNVHTGKMSVEDAIINFKCLWEGQEPRDGTGECQHKGKLALAAADNDNRLPRCLDCGEEVERRSGVGRREGSGRRFYDGILEPRGDRRSGSDRRKAGSG